MDNSNILKKIYPKPSYNNYSNLSYDTEGLYSITHPNDANLISTNIIKVLDSMNPTNSSNTTNSSNQYTIVDMTAGCGGNLISFCEYFNTVVGVENNIERYKILKKNMLSYNYNNYKIICDDSVKFISSNIFDAYFIDPPWGGPEYKKNNNIELTISGITLVELILLIPKNKLIVLKLPFNYNISTFDSFTVLLKLEIKNMLLLFLVYN